MTTRETITRTTSKNQSQEKDQEPRPLPDTDHYTEQTTRHEQQDSRTKRSRERSEDAHLGITIRGAGPASGRHLAPRAAGFRQERPPSTSIRSSGC